MKKAERIWVDPDFAKILKINASIEGLKIIPYTKKLSVSFDELTQKKIVVDNKIRGNKYEFKF